MDFTVEESDGVRIVHIEGPIDVGRAVALRDLLGEQLDSPTSRVLIDLAEVTLIDSSGIGIFIAAHRRAEGQGARIVLAAAREPVGRVFELTRTNKLLQIHATIAEGLVALRSGD